MIALFTTCPRSERSYIAPVVPLYLFYAIAHIAPMTVGFGNWISLKLWRRRLYRDHYEPRPRVGEPTENSPASMRGAA